MKVTERQSLANSLSSCLYGFELTCGHCLQIWTNAFQIGSMCALLIGIKLEEYLVDLLDFL